MVLCKFIKFDFKIENKKKNIKFKKSFLIFLILKIIILFAIINELLRLSTIIRGLTKLVKLKFRLEH